MKAQKLVAIGLTAMLIGGFGRLPAQALTERVEINEDSNLFTDRKDPWMALTLHTILPGSEALYLSQGYVARNERGTLQDRNTADNVWVWVTSRLLTMGALYFLLTSPNTAGGPAVRDWRLALDLSYWGSALVGPLILPLHAFGVMADVERYNDIAARNEAFVAQRERERVAAAEREAAERERARPALPPQLAASITFRDPHGKGVLLAEDSAELLLKVSNSGRGAAKRVKGSIKLVEKVAGLTLPDHFVLGNLDPGKETTVRIPLVGARELAGGKATVEITVVDAYENDAPLVRASFETRAFKAPRLEVAEVGVVDGNNNGIIERGEQLDLSVVVRNVGEGYARNVQATLVLNDPKISMVEEGTNVAQTPVLAPGEWKTAAFSILVRNLYAGPQQLPLNVILSESHDDLTVTEPLKVSLHQAGPMIRQYVATGSPDVAARPQELPDVTVDVDEVPASATRREHAVAAVVGIERYAKVPPVNFARRDATIVKEYLVKTLGIPTENIVFLTDEQATLGNLRTAIEGRLGSMVEPGESDVYVYYAGHGAPDLRTKTPFIVPYDGDPAYPDTSCYSLAGAYEALSKLGAKSVTVMLDSCFSGGVGRGDAQQTLVANARPIMMETKAATIPDGLTVLAAARGDQISSGLDSKRHGLFTYYLLKGLKGSADLDQNDEILLSEVFQYLKPQVEREARRMNREQVPDMVGPDGVALQLK